MPNTACAFGKGVTALYAKDQSSLHSRLQAIYLMKLGHVLALKMKMKCIDLPASLEVAKLFFFKCLILSQRARKK